MSPHRVSIADLARQLGVSVSTVSRALTLSPEVSEVTRRRVQQLALATGYQPNQTAVSLRKGRTTTLGVLVPHLTGAFFAEVIDGISEAASRAGYNVMLCQSHDDERQQQRSLALLLSAPVAGLLVWLASPTHELAPFEAARAARVPLVLLEQAGGLSGIGIGSVMLDDFAGAYAAVTHLLEQGCRRVAHLAGPLGTACYQQRQRGYRQALHDHHLPYHPELVYETAPSQPGGAAGMQQLLTLPELPDAVFSSSDAAVAGALRVLRTHGLRVPADVALAGFSNAEFTALTEPPLTTVDPCGQQMGGEAVRQLLHLLRTDTPSTPVVLRPRLLVRASSQRLVA